jgi:hypothetical protein
LVLVFRRGKVRDFDFELRRERMNGGVKEPKERWWRKVPSRRERGELRYQEEGERFVTVREEEVEISTVQLQIRPARFFAVARVL